MGARFIGRKRATISSHEPQASARGKPARGRFSQPGQAYLLTLVADDRAPVFDDFTAARCFGDSALHRYGTTLVFIVMPDHVHWRLELAPDFSGSVAAESHSRRRPGLSVAALRAVG